MALPFSIRPQSVTGLILTSFGVVALPLVIAVVFGVVYVDRLSDQSERLVVQGVKVTRESRRLDSIIVDMERNARQYSVLDDPQLQQAFERQHRAFQKTLDALQKLRLDTLADWKLDELRAQGQTIANAVTHAPPNQALIHDQLALFVPLRKQASAISAEGNRFIDNEITNLQSTSREARAFLVLCIFALIPAVILLVVVLTTLISRPIGQIRLAIRKLGQGEFDKPVAVSAPTRELDAVATNLNWMRRRLRAAESEKNQFLRRMSHELKTPLASIREGVELMYDGTLGELNTAQTEVVGILQENSLELLFLIENLLNFAAWQQYRSKLEYSCFELNQIADEAISRHSLSIERKQLRLEKAYSFTEITADRDQIRLLFDNLITNAIKFSPKSGRLLLHITSSSTHVVILVSDDGPGIAQSERDHVFNSFYQSKLPKHTHVQGTGIGLSVVREVTQAHGGDARVVDNKYSNGACLRISLPCAPDTITKSG